jgi:hypothetical protein
MSHGKLNIIAQALIAEADEMKARSEVRYEVCEMKIGPECYVRVTQPNAVPKHVYGFATEREAREWIRRREG